MRQLKISKSITNRSNASLDKYLQEISKEEMVTVEEEIELAQRIRNGDQSALERLVKANLRFVVSVAKQYQNQGLSVSDLINEGNVGLIKAAEKFDEMRGFKFISYAVWWIRQSIMQALAEQSRLIRLPINQVSSISKISKVRSKFEQQNERKPAIHEIAEILEISEEKVKDSLRITPHTLSFDAPISDEENGYLMDILENPEALGTDHKLTGESLHKEIDRALSTLTQREGDVIRFSFGIRREELSLDEIGNVLGLSRERVRQIREQAIRRLRNSSRSNLLKSYL